MHRQTMIESTFGRKAKKSHRHHFASICIKLGKGHFGTNSNVVLTCAHKLLRTNDL